MERIAKIKEQNHEHEEDSKSIDFNEESEVTFQEDEEEHNRDAYAHIGQRELIKGNLVNIGLRARTKYEINNPLNARI